MRRLLPLVFVAAIAAGCGHSSRNATPPPTSTGTTPSAPATTSSTSGTTTTEAMTTSLRIYLLRDGKVAPARRDVPATAEVATAVVHALAQGPTTQERSAGLSTAYPTGSPVTGITVDNGVATATLNETLSHAALAQLVYTLTQFATVQGVRTSRMIG